MATGDSTYLQTYYTSEVAWLNDSTVVARTQSAIPALAGRVQRSLVAAQDVQRYFRDELGLMRSGRQSTAKAELSRGKRLFDRLRVLDAYVQRQADAELRMQRSHTRVLAQAGFSAAIVLCAIVALWLFVFLFVLSRVRVYRLNSLRDSLTGAQNRAGAIAAIDSQVGAADPQEFALVFIDLDGFKKINDVYGHATGDGILRSVADRLQMELRDADTVCRLGGDEFVCIIAPPASPEQARAIATRLCKTVSAPYTLEGDTFVVGCSVGLSLYPQHGATAEALLARADSAMYAAKAAGGGVREATAVAPW